VRKHVMRGVTLVVAVGLAGWLLAAPSFAGGTTTLAANLSGEAEVPGPGDANGEGLAVITLNSVAGTVCFSLDWDRIRAPFMAHIHRGEEGVAGPIRVVLFMQPNETPLDNTITGVDGCARDVETALIERIASNPSNFYVNIHNKPYPAGAIRGQLGPAV
jgi:CHRD domain-containing protein